MNIFTVSAVLKGKMYSLPNPPLRAKFLSSSKTPKSDEDEGRVTLIFRAWVGRSKPPTGKTRQRAHTDFLHMGIEEACCIAVSPKVLLREQERGGN